jgi:transglutaminase-like putative cysteine protease
MKFSFRLAAYFAVVIFVCLFCLYPKNKVFAGDEWRPVLPAELQMKASTVEPNADAEVLFWEVRIDDSDFEHLIMKHYIRVKIFTERGREKYSKVDIPYYRSFKIKDISARVIKPDGSITELAKAEVFDREIVRKDKLKIKAKSFAVSGLDIGSIFEYRYTEDIPFGSADGMRMLFQHDVPIQKITYYFKPYNRDVRYMTFNMLENKFNKDKNGFYVAEMKNVPSIKEEPFMPPEDEVRSWLLCYYVSERKLDAMDFWARAGSAIKESFGIKDTLKPGSQIKQLAAEITAGATTPEEKLSKLFLYTKQQIKNLTYDPSLTDDQREQIKPNKDASDTLKKKQGFASDINELFASLASAAGFETRLAFGGDRSKKFFNVQQAHTSFIHFAAVAVKVGDTWKYFSPGDYFVPYGMLTWKEEDTGALLLGTKDYIVSTTPYSTPASTNEKRFARLKLDADGTLTGLVKITYTGNLANEIKSDEFDDSAAKREENFKERIKQRISNAEISELSIENMDDPEKPLVYTFNIKVPNYGQKTGKRIFFQPGFFEYGNPPAFSTETRNYPIFFHFPWSEDEDIQIQLPDNFSLESADSPGLVADPQGISKLEIRIGIDKANNTLVYRRHFEFGNRGYTLFPKDSYQAIKMLFDAFHKSDSHTLTLRQN